MPNILIPYDPSTPVANWVRIDNIKNHEAAGAPGVGDDDADGYEVFSRWKNTSTDDIYECVSAATGAAVWALVGAAAGFQPLDADLTAIAALAGTSGFLTKTAADTWALDTNTYLTAATADALFLTPAEGNAAYQPLDADLTALAALTGTDTIYYRSAADTWTAVTIGSGLAFAGGSLTASGGSTSTGFALINGYITATVASNALTIAIKNSAGADPSAGAPVTVQFRDATAGTGALTTLTLTAATSLVVSSGSTLGTVSAKTQRLWVVGFNDGGTFRLGVILCTERSFGSIFPLRDYMLTSSSAEGGAGAADSSLVIYTGTAVTTKAMRVLAWLESSQTTAGTWAAAPVKIHQHSPGDPLPGDPVQTVNSIDVSMATGGTQIPFDDTIPQSGEGNQYLTISVSKSSDANLLQVEANLQVSLGGTDAVVTMALFVDSEASARAAHMYTFTAAAANIARYPFAALLNFDGFSATSTLKIRMGPSTASGTTLTLNGFSGARYMGGTLESWLKATEIMT